MKLQDLQYLPPITLAASQTVYRVQRIRGRPGAASIGPLKMAPIGDMSSRFAVSSAEAGYFAESPQTTIYESLVRREAVALSISNAASRQLLCLRPTRPVHLLDLRQHASSWSVLQSLRFSATQEIAEEALAAGFEGIAYRSAHQYGQDCFVVFGDALKALKLVWRKALLLEDGSVHQALAAAMRGGQIMVVPQGRHTIEVTKVDHFGMIFGMNAQIAHEDVPRLVGEAEFMQSLNWSERSLAKAVADGSVFVMRQGGLDVYPSFFADPRFDQRHLKVICRRLGDLPGGSKWQFFTTPKGSLGGITPLVALQRGMRAALVGAGVNPRLFAVEDAAFCECRA